MASHVKVLGAIFLLLGAFGVIAGVLASAAFGLLTGVASATAEDPLGPTILGLTGRRPLSWLVTPADWLLRRTTNDRIGAHSCPTRDGAPCGGVRPLDETARAVKVPAFGMVE